MMTIIRGHCAFSRITIERFSLFLFAGLVVACSVRDRKYANGQTQEVPNRVSVGLQPDDEIRKRLIAMPRTFFFESESGLAICKAIEDRDFRTLRDLIASGAELNRQEKGGITVLFWAFMQNNLEAFKMLLDHGANPDLKLNFDESLRHAFAGKADPNPKRPYGTSFSYWNESVLYSIVTKWTVRREFLEPALRSSRDPSHRDITHGTLYHRCAMFHADPQLIEILLKYPIDLNVQNLSGETACVHFLRNGKHAACLLLLKHGADPSIRDTEGKDLQSILDMHLKLASKKVENGTIQPNPSATDSKDGDWAEGTSGYGLGPGRLYEIQEWLTTHKK